MSQLTARAAARALAVQASRDKALFSQRFFKTGPGEYAHGDVFIGVTVPEVRAVAKTFAALALEEVLRLLRSRIHEERMLALVLLVARYRHEPDEVYGAYTAHFAHINNWDLVDVSAPGIVGAHLLLRERTPLYRFVRSPLLWERRIAIVATLHFIRNGELDDTFALAERLLDDEEDLLHKATGWMLREAGKRDEAALLRFLMQHRERMPRTMLRYAIEKLVPKERKRLLARVAPT